MKHMPTPADCYREAAAYIVKMSLAHTTENRDFLQQVSQQWRWLGDSIRDMPQSTGEGSAERAPQWDHDRRAPVGFGR